MTRYRLEDLLPMAHAQLAEVFRSLPAPTREEMDGEFASYLPKAMEEEWRATQKALGRNYWLGKSYSPDTHSGHHGQGLNSYERADGSIVRMSRFVWDIDASIVDGQPCLVMYYAVFDNWGGGHDLIDEVRRAGDGVYLGIYHTKEPVPGFTPRSGDGTGRSGFEFFMLTGPFADFVPADAD